MSRAITRVVVVAAVVGAVLGAVVAEAAGPYQYYPLTPCRVVDTRSGYGGILYKGVVRTFTVKNANGCGVPTDAQAVSLNVTMTQANDGGYIQLYPTGGSAGSTSTINFASWNWALANGAIVPLAAQSTNELAVFLATFNPGGVSHVILDVTGYFK